MIRVYEFAGGTKAAGRGVYQARRHARFQVKAAPGAVVSKGEETLDGRYAIALEYCGYETPRFVLRLCGGWVSQHTSSVEAFKAGQDHRP